MPNSKRSNANVRSMGKMVERAFSGSIKPFFGLKTARFSGKSGKIKKRRTQISKVPNAERTQTQNARF